MASNGEIISSGFLVGGYFAFVLSGSIGFQTGNSLYHWVSLCVIVPSLIHSRWHYKKYHTKKNDAEVLLDETGGKS